MYEKYAELLLKKCINIKKGQPLIINGPIENFDFIKVIRDKAKSLGVDDIYVDVYNNDYKESILKTLSNEEIDNHPYFNKSIYDEYAKECCATIVLYASSNYKPKNIDESKLTRSKEIYLNTGNLYRDMVNRNEIPWVIASVATTEFANIVFPNDSNNIDKLWNTLFSILDLNSVNPIEKWDKIIKENNEKCNRLNELKFNTLYFKNELGTNFSLSLDKTSTWKYLKKDNKGNMFIPNMPTFQINTSPIKTSASGNIYVSKPFIYEDYIIENFMLNFKNGRVDKVKGIAELEELKRILLLDAGASYLGEVSLVDNNSSISKSHVIFNNDLLDANASTHISLGDGRYMSNTSNLNKSNIKADIMIGTSDLEITGITYDKEKYKIFENGNYDLRKVR